MLPPPALTDSALTGESRRASPRGASPYLLILGYVNCILPEVFLCSSFWNTARDGDVGLFRQVVFQQNHLLWSDPDRPLDLRVAADVVVGLQRRDGAVVWDKVLESATCPS